MNAWDIKREAAIPMWEERIKECRSSELSVKEWCAGKGISRRTYYKWESLCLARASESMARGTAISAEKHSMIQIDPSLLPSNPEPPEMSAATNSTELVIHCGSVRMEISSQMPVTRIADLVRALNSHV